MKRPVALVTGASAGIGHAFAVELAHRGHDLVLVARRQERLDRICKELSSRYGIQCYRETLDLAQRGAVKDLLGRLDAQDLTVEVLVNNAGYGLSGSFLSRRWQQHEDFLQLLLVVVCELTHGVLPGMKERGHGRIIQVSSVAGFLPGTAGHTLYGAVKSALNVFTECLSLECRGSGIHVTSLCPGFTTTEFHDVNGTREMMSKMPGFMWLDANRVAREALDACDQGEVYCIPGLFYRMLLRFLALLPARIRRAFVGSRGSSFRDSSENQVADQGSKDSIDE